MDKGYFPYLYNGKKLKIFFKTTNKFGILLSYI